MDEKTKLRRFILLGLLVISAVVGWHVYEYLIKGRGECHHETPFVRDIVQLSRNLYDLEVQTGVTFLDNVDYQGRTTLHSRDDQAQFPLFQRIDDCFSLNESTTIYLLERLYDNYALDSNFREKFSAVNKQEELDFLRAILKTPIMRRAMKFLHSKAAVDADDDNAQLRLLQDIWFTQYSRGGREVGSSGFEHVFLAELKAGSVLGLHNWIYFREQERQGNLDYKGFITLLELNKKRHLHVAAVRFRFHNIIKPYNTIFVGTSPELEMSLYTVCFVLNSDRPCPIELGHSELTIITHSWKWMGKQVIAAAYPSIYLGYGRHKAIRVKTRLDALNLVDVLRDDPPTEGTAKIEFFKMDKGQRI